jgi:hypothetical protein
MLEPSQMRKRPHYHHTKDDTMPLPVRMSQVSEMKNIQEHHEYVSGGVADRNSRVRSKIYPAVGEDEENRNCEEEASAREPLNKCVVKEKKRQSDEQQKRENMIVTSGGLIFLAIAALLVTASFLMSPVIQTIFSKCLPFSFSRLYFGWFKYL